MKKSSLHLSCFLASSSVSAFSPLPSPNRCRFSPSRPNSSSRRSSSSSLALAFDVQTFQSAAAAVDNFYKTAPIESAFLTCGIKGSLADAFAQRLDDEKKSTQAQDVSNAAIPTARGDADLADTSESHFNTPRNLAYVIYGGMYTGIAQHFIYNELFPHVFGHDPTAMTVFLEVVANALLVGPLLGLPAAYLTKALVLHPSDNPISEGLRRYAEDVQLKGLLLKYWALWVPVQTLTFSVVPEHLRISFMAAVSFFWFVILSTVSAEGQDEASSNSENGALTSTEFEEQDTYPFPQRP